jgi:hypothetical protein
VLSHQSTSLDSCGHIDLGIEAGNITGPISSISVPAHSPNKFALLFAMPNNQPGVLEHITQNKENLAKTSAELLKKEEELSQVKTPEKAKLKGLFSQIPASTDVLLAGMTYEWFTQSAIRTASRGASGTLSIQQRLSALETTIAELKTTNDQLKTTNDQLKTTNEQLRTTNGRLITKIRQLETSLGDVSKTVQCVCKFMSVLLYPC